MKKSDDDRTDVKLCATVVGGRNGEDGEMSVGEKNICFQVLGPLPPLPYPTIETLCDDGFTQTEYVIPDQDREKVLNELCFFSPVPALDDRMYDLHEGKEFIVREYRVIRWHETNIIASPYYPHSGGMLVDFVQPLKSNDEAMVMTINSKYRNNLEKTGD